MNKLEIALRNALAKGDMDDAAFRRRIYEAAAKALQRSGREGDAAASAALAKQMDGLTEAIRAIEADFGSKEAGEVAAPPESGAVEQAPANVEPPPVQPDSAPGGAMAAPGVTPPTDKVASATPDHVYVEPRPESIVQQRRAAEPARSRSRSRFRFDRGPFASIFSGLVLAALLFAGLWWVIVSGAFVSEEARDTSVPNPPLRLDEETFAGRDPGTATAPQRPTDEVGTEWVILFTPADPTTLRLEGGATASVETDPFGDFARLVAPGEGRILIDVPPGTLQSLVGRRAQISLRVRSDDGEPTQMSVTCDFGTLGDCGRRRFNIDQAETELLFHVDLPDGAGPNERGSLILRTDIADDGRAINLLGARIRPAQTQ